MYFFANDSVGNKNQTDIQSFIVQEIPTNLTFSVNQTMYPQGMGSQSIEPQFYIPFQVKISVNNERLSL